MLQSKMRFADPGGNKSRGLIYVGEGNPKSHAVGARLGGRDRVAYGGAM